MVVGTLRVPYTLEHNIDGTRSVPTTMNIYEEKESGSKHDSQYKLSVMQFS